MWQNILALWKSDSLLDEAWQDSYKMLDIDHEMFEQARHILRQTEGQEGGEVVAARDREVDAFEQDVRRKVLTHCVVQGSADLAPAMVLVTIVTDIERIGDYTKSIVELARNYPTRLEGGPLEADLQRIEAAVSKSFERTRRCIETSDVQLANEQLTETTWLSRLCDDRVLDLVRAPAPELTTAQAVALALYLRQLKRINGHLGDVATAVVNPFDRIGVTSEET